MGRFEELTKMGGNLDERTETEINRYVFLPSPSFDPSLE